MGLRHQCYAAVYFEIWPKPQHLIRRTRADAYACFDCHAAKEIDNFKAEDYWELKTVYRDVVFNLAKGRFESEEKAQQALNEISTLPFSIVDCKTKRGKESAPRLFDLTSLQVECNKKYGFSADETLRLIQSLYEKKFTTYPRVDTTYLSDDMYPKIPAILEALRPYASLTATLLDKKSRSQRKYSTMQK